MKLKSPAAVVRGGPLIRVRWRAHGRAIVAPHGRAMCACRASRPSRWPQLRARRCALDARRWAGRMSGRAQTIAQVASRCCAARGDTPHLMLRRWKHAGRRWASFVRRCWPTIGRWLRAGRAMGARRCARPRVVLGIRIRPPARQRKNKKQVPGGDQYKKSDNYNNHCGSLRQSGPRPDPRLLRQAALEALTRSARTDSPRRRINSSAS
ncbi:hypothetical protein F511_30480 [Dorcoceras hygrometricum]|uniref:Uncharacterized protein n=1 Tax=Dorcoceras hygrometricum TaxID=472368 RepID=A0A2Z7BX95_9LAMI|nr:hypothetical protein F511_30480 [Dorcoceras hygrometricum]